MESYCPRFFAAGDQHPGSSLSGVKIGICLWLASDTIRWPTMTMRSKRDISRPADCPTALQKSPSVPSFDSCVENKIIGQRTDGDQNFKYVWVLVVPTPPEQHRKTSNTQLGALPRTGGDRHPLRRVQAILQASLDLGDRRDRKLRKSCKRLISEPDGFMARDNSRTCLVELISPGEQGCLSKSST